MRITELQRHECTIQTDGLTQQQIHVPFHVTKRSKNQTYEDRLHGQNANEKTTVRPLRHRRAPMHRLHDVLQLR